MTEDGHVGVRRQFSPSYVTCAVVLLLPNKDNHFDRGLRVDRVDRGALSVPCMIKLRD